MITAHYSRIVMVILLPITLIFLIYYGIGSTGHTTTVTTTTTTASENNNIYKQTNEIYEQANDIYEKTNDRFEQINDKYEQINDRYEQINDIYEQANNRYEEANNRYEEANNKYNQTNKREKAAFVVLARNDDLFGIRGSMKMMEDRFNGKFNYPWVFLNDEPFSEEFKEWTTNIASGETFYGTLEYRMWGYPDWIDQERAREAREQMEQDDIIYGGSESYRHMCRFQSGFFFRHPLLDQFDYYWRVEPDVKFLCDVDYDPFKLMRERDLKYGFAISLKEYENTIPTLWETTKKFMERYPQHIRPLNDPESLLSWVTEDGGQTYNLCHFWSNFEIGSIAWLRSKPYMDYFNFLDKSGGFFYERWGDAPVHSIAAALLLKKSEVHYFYDMGYFHDPFSQCPREPAWLPAEKCTCNPAESLDKDDYSCTPRFLEVTGKSNTDFVVTQRS